MEQRHFAGPSRPRVGESMCHHHRQTAMRNSGEKESHWKVDNIITKLQDGERSTNTENPLGVQFPTRDVSQRSSVAYMSPQEVTTATVDWVLLRHRAIWCRGGPEGNAIHFREGDVHHEREFKNCKTYPRCQPIQRQGFGECPIRWKRK